MNRTVAELDLYRTETVLDAVRIIRKFAVKLVQFLNHKGEEYGQTMPENR